MLVHTARRRKILQKLIVASSPSSVPIYALGHDQLEPDLPNDSREELESSDYESAG